MNKRIIKFKEFKHHCRTLCYDIDDYMEENPDWVPSYIVGITRGGLLPAVLLSHYFGIPMYTLKISLRNKSKLSNTESNLWMAEDAHRGENILIVDDINDTGATFNWVVSDWESSASPKDKWKDVWNNNVKFCTIFNNSASKFSKSVDFFSERIDKSKEDVWIEFPYENWIEKR